MSRYSYDDMPPARSSRRGSSKKFTIIFICILVIAVCAIIYIAFQPSEKRQDPAPVAPQVETEDESLMGLDIPEVNEIVIVNPPALEEEPAQPVEEPEVDDEERFLSIFTEYLVESDDTINSIALQFDVSPQTIANVNAITDMTDVRKGMVLYIPEMDGQVYVVKPGDTLEDIISKYNPEMTLDELMELNRLESGSLDGIERLFIPEYRTEEEVEDVFFKRPVNGSIKHAFGEIYNDRKLDGIAIEVVPGSAVECIAAGFVADVGADPVFGRYVTVVHENGYKSHYYSLETVAVRIGDVLSQGDILGSVGTSSRYFGSPCLFFRLEQGVLKLDPMLFL